MAVSKQMNVYLIGPMGAGKTSIGRILARDLNLEYYDSDQEVESRAGVDLSWIFDVEGEEGFRKRELVVIEDLSNKQGIVLSTGGGTVVNEKVRNILSSRGTVVFLEASIEQQVERTSRGNSRPMLACDNPREMILQLNAEREPLYREIADFTFDTDGRSVSIVAQDIVEELSKPIAS